MSEVADRTYCFTAGFYVSDLYDELQEIIYNKEEITKEVIAEANLMKELTKPCINEEAVSIFDELVSVLRKGDYNLAKKLTHDLGAKFAIKIPFKKAKD